VSVICDISYLSLYANSDGLPTEQQEQTQALFILNIIFGVGTIMMDLLVLCVRRGVLTEIKDSTLPSSSSEARRPSAVEMGDVYKSNDDEIPGGGGVSGPGHVPNTANPMHGMTLSLVEELRDKNTKLSDKNTKLSDKNTKLETENEELRRRLEGDQEGQSGCGAADMDIEARGTNNPLQTRAAVSADHEDGTHQETPIQPGAGEDLAVQL
jgi:hypothetical protein